MLLSVGALMVWHLFLVFTAQTSIEFYLNRYAAQEMRLKGGVGPRVLRRRARRDPCARPGRSS